MKLIPDGLSPSETKLLAARMAMMGLGVVTHALHVGCYLVLGIAPMVWANILSMAIFGAAVLLVRVGHPRLGLSLGFGEVVAHATIMGIALGHVAGYPLFLFIAAAASFLGFTSREPFLRFFWALAAVIAYPVTNEVAKGVPMVFELEASGLALIYYVNVLDTFIALSGLSFFFMHTAESAERKIEAEHARGEAILHNILPLPIIERIKNGEKTIADQCDGVSVVFADICGFTTLSQRVTTVELIDMLNEMFTGFDHLADDIGLEKIKTMGDAYMAVAGIPEPCEDHTLRAVKMGLAMLKQVRAFSERTQSGLNVRVGVHTGPVVAGVIGRRKFVYDLWGDTVNTASRMESHGAPGRVHISEDAKAELEGAGYALVERGTIEVKGKGEMKTYFVEPHPEEFDLGDDEPVQWEERSLGSLIRAQ